MGTVSARAWPGRVRTMRFGMRTTTRTRPTPLLEGLLSLEQAHDALILLDVPAVLVVISRDRDGTDVRPVRFPDTRTFHERAFELLSRAAQLVELDLHSSQHTVELGDIS